MDTLYIGDIPQEYHFAIFNNGYIDLYNTSELRNNTYTYYRIYTNAGGFYYKIDTQTYSDYRTTYATSITVTDDYKYRTDYSNICSTAFLHILLILFALNIITSLIRKGGSLGGLL